MVGLGTFLLDGNAIGAVLSDSDGSVRAALVCWAVAVSAFVILKVPRQVVLACLFAGTVTVGLAALFADATPIEVTASTAAPEATPARYRSIPPPSSAGDSHRLR